MPDIPPPVFFSADESPVTQAQPQGNTGDEMLDDCFNAFMLAHPPANKGDCDDVMTTLQVLEMLQAHYDADISIHTVYQLMRKANYSQWVEGDRFVWGVVNEVIV